MSVNRVVDTTLEPEIRVRSPPVDCASMVVDKIGRGTKQPITGIKHASPRQVIPKDPSSIKGNRLDGKIHLRWSKMLSEDGPKVRFNALFRHGLGQ
jgi:hypothetical protein